MNSIFNKMLEYIVYTYERLATRHVREINLKANKKKGLDMNGISIAFQWSLKIASFWRKYFIKKYLFSTARNVFILQRIRATFYHQTNADLKRTTKADDMTICWLSCTFLLIHCILLYKLLDWKLRKRNVFAECTIFI